MLRFLVLLAALLAAGSAAATTIKPFEAGGNWYGEAHFDEQDGHFVLCAVTADYEPDFRLGFAIGPDNELGILLRRTSWNMETGLKFGFEFSVDNRWSRSIDAVVSDPQSIVAFAGADSAGLEALRRGHVLTVKSGAETYSFQLVGSSHALARASRCVLAHTGGGGSFTAGSGASGETPADQVADLLLASGVENAVMMTPEQARDAWGSGKVGWYIESGIGGMFTDKTNGKSPDAFLNDFIANTSSGCAGEYTTAFKPAPVRSMRRFFSTCRQGGVVAHVFGIVVFFDDGDAMSVIHFADDASFAAVSTADERIVNGLIAWGAE